MKIVIAGSGKVGAVLAEQLSKIGHDVLVIDNVEENLAYIENTLDVMCVTGNAASLAVMDDIDIEQCDLLIAMTGSDETNIVICLIAKKLGVKYTIARIRNPLYAESADLIKEDMGLSMAINPEYEAAVEIFRTLRHRHASQIDTLAKSNVEVTTCLVPSYAPICGVYVKDLYKTVGAKIFACGIKRGNEIFIPNGSTQIHAGDTFSFIASPEDTYRFFKKMKYDTGRINNLAIIGGGRLAFYLARLCMDNGIPVKIVDKNKQTCIALKELLPGAEIIYGDGTDTRLIEEEGILRASAIATATGVDSTNLLLSMYFTKNAPSAKVITKIKKSDFEDIMYNVNIGSVFYPKYITADRIVKYISAMENSLYDEMQSLYHVIDNKVEIMEFMIKEGSPNLSVPIMNLKFKDDLLLANIARRSQSFIPGGTDTLEAGDTILVVTTRHDIRGYTDIFI